MLIGDSFYGLCTALSSGFDKVKKGITGRNNFYNVTPTPISTDSSSGELSLYGEYSFKEKANDLWNKMKDVLGAFNPATAPLNSSKEDFVLDEADGVINCRKELDPIHDHEPSFREKAVRAWCHIKARLTLYDPVEAIFGASHKVIQISEEGDEIETRYVKNLGLLGEAQKAAESFGHRLANGTHSLLRELTR